MVMALTGHLGGPTYPRPRDWAASGAVHAVKCAASDDESVATSGDAGGAGASVETTTGTAPRESSLQQSEVLIASVSAAAREDECAVWQQGVERTCAIAAQ